MMTALPKPSRLIWLAASSMLFMFVVLAACVTIDHARLSHLIEAQRQADASARLLALTRRVAALEHVAALELERPAAARKREVERVTEALDARLGALERVAQEATSTTPTAELRTRLAALESKVDALGHAATSTPIRRRAAKTKVLAKPLVPAFALLGVDRRADESFLAVAPVGSHALSAVSLWRAGETRQGWTLMSFDAHAATFQVGERLARVELR